MWIFILCLIGFLLIFADTSILAARDAMELILYNLLPTMFPFFVLTNLLSRSGKISLLTGFLCGYPAGAMACAQLYKNGFISKEEACRYSMFTNNAGPTFLVGAIGAGMCASKAIGFLFLFVHIAAALSVAIIAKCYFPKSTTPTRLSAQNMQPLPLGTQLTEAVTGAIKQIAIVCGYVLLFGVLLGILQTIGIDSPVLFSFLEITTGMNCLLTPLGSPASMPALLTLLPFTAILLGFSGLSIHAQIIAILNRAGLPARYFIIGKILQAVFSGLYAYLLLQIPPIYTWLADSSLSISTAVGVSPETTAFSNMHLLFIEATFTIGIYCATIKRKLKQISLL